MNYPAWDVPVIGSSLVIAIIAIVHVYISHFAVGGGLFLPLLERHALKQGRRDWLAVVQTHSRFFLIVTSIFGAVTGVGIWFAIGLGSAPGTSTLIHYWVFGWGMEWCVFVIELAAAAAYYYLWGRVSDQTHVKIGYLYAISSWLTLLIINGILTFMLTPTDAWLNAIGTPDAAGFLLFWKAFFNPTYLPSLLIRTLICASLAGVWAFWTVSRLDSQVHGDLKRELAAWTRQWLLPSFVILPILVIWYVSNVPPEQRELLLRGVGTAAPGQFTAATRMVMVTALASMATVVAAFLFTDQRNAPDFSVGGAAAIALTAFIAFGTSETVREMLRKPYVVGGYMYSNGVRLRDVEKHNAEGYLTRAPMAYGATPGDIGELMFRGQCLSCHTREGYRAMRGLLAGRNHEGIVNLLQVLHEYRADSPYRSYMPPLVGTPGEIAALATYLEGLTDLGAPAPLPTSSSGGAAPAPAPAPAPDSAVPPAPAASAAVEPAPPAASVAPALPAAPAAPVGAAPTSAVPAAPLPAPAPAASALPAPPTN
ncbi:MAG: cytochrome ubiquinol oxidase subunit I [Fimbriimonadaceae bacterium]|nr:cytochrome ubiquinol oxidase subunit I [Fimbriimonadaceae bacterium]